MRRVRYLNIKQLQHYMRIGDLVCISSFFSKKIKRAGVITCRVPLTISWGSKTEVEFEKILKAKFWRSIFLYHLSKPCREKIPFGTSSNILPIVFSQEDKKLNDIDLILKCLRKLNIDLPVGTTFKDLFNGNLFRDLYFELRTKKVDSKKQF